MRIVPLNVSEKTVVSDETKGGGAAETVAVEKPLSLTFEFGADLSNRQFGRYRILKEIGRGAMGAVYLAHDDQLDRDIALKIPQFAADMHGSILERFYREARAAATLRHPGICPVFDVGEISGQHYITMALIKGRPLRDFTKSSRSQRLTQTVRVIRKLALALNEAHKHDVVHRDLKPANIMIDERQEPVVMDFGLAQRSTDKEAKLTHSGTVIGTPAYMSPEQVDGENDRVGPTADIYSLGVIFYELLTDQLPFQGNLMSILKQIASAEPKHPSALNPDVPDALEAICLKMMAKRSDDRFQSMETVAAELSSWLKIVDAGTEESGMLETSRVPSGQSGTAPEMEVTSPLAVPKVDSENPDARSTSDETAEPSALPLSSQRIGTRGLLIGLSLIVAGVTLSGVVFILQLGKVKVQITVDDPSLSLKVDGDNVFISGKGTPIRLSAGEHKIVVERDGLVAATEEFVVKSHGKNSIHVKVLNEGVVILKDGQRSLPNVSGSKNPPLVIRPIPSTQRGKRPPVAQIPFDAGTAMSLQMKWAEYLGIPISREVDLPGGHQMAFVLIPPGEYAMGAPSDSVNVKLTRAIYIGVTEVTQVQFGSLSTRIPKEWGTRADTLVGKNFAANWVSWDDATRLCEKLTKQHRDSGQISRHEEYRLPTEAEWEFAARAGSGKAFSFGADASRLGEFGWFRDNSKLAGEGYAHRVAQKKPNAWGLHDTHGNLREYCRDAYVETLPGGTDPEIRVGLQRVIRGGAWNDKASDCDVCKRTKKESGWYTLGHGFRIVLTVDTASDGPS